MLTFVLIVIAAIFLGLAGLWLFGERWRLMRPTTWKLIKMGGIKQLLNFSLLHAYTYGRFTNQYVGTLIHQIFPRLGPKGKKWLTDRYHAKIVPHHHAKDLVSLGKDIPFTDLEQVIPYPIARSILLDANPYIIAYECPCRHSRENHCEPTQVCFAVGKPFADFIHEHNPRTARRITSSEAVQILEEEHRRGHIHTAWFKDVLFGRFYSLCNCCKCCCGGIEAMVKHGMPMLAPSGYIAQTDKDLCNKCGACVNSCPFNAISLENDRISLDWAKCMGCGACIDVCVPQARSLVLDEKKGAPLDVVALTKDKSAS